MDLKAKLSELENRYQDLAAQKIQIHLDMKDIKKKIQKFETVLKHAEEIESVEEKPLV